MSAKVGIIMGSRSDWETMQQCSETLNALGIAHEVQVISAHRTPDRLFEYAESAVERGLQVATVASSTRPASFTTISRALTSSS